MSDDTYTLVRPIVESYPRVFTQETRRGEDLILGLGAFGHDAAVALIDTRDGRVLYAVAEERLTNRKHDWHYPIGAIHECCDEAVRIGRPISAVAVNFRADEFLSKTLCQEIDRIGGSAPGTAELKSGLLKLFPQAEYFSVRDPNPTTDAIASLLEACALRNSSREELVLRLTWYFNWGVKYRRLEQIIRSHFQGIPIHFVNHHLAHAASAFYSSGMDRATVLVIDGSGESDTVSVYRGDHRGLSLVSRTGWPHSLGIFYLFATQHLGFGLGDEYKVMGMSAYGCPRFAPLLQGSMCVLDNGELCLQETEYHQLGNLGGTGHRVFQFTDSLRAILPVRDRSEPFRQEHFDFAASVQQLTENTGVALARQAIALTGLPDLALAGGVALNGLMNEAIRRRSGVRDLFVYPAAGDDGTAVGAAQWVLAQDQPLPRYRLRSCYFGRDVNRDDISGTLRDRGIQYSRPHSIHETIARALADGQIVARCHGQAEFGPRALGHRSILAHPGLASMKDTLNARVKHREEFRPFAPACLYERMSEFFELAEEAPFMLLIAQATELARREVSAVVHADGTARVQSVTLAENPDFHQTLKAFELLTGIPIVLNTSFNVNGETIVDGALDALESFGFMDIDYLAIGPFWVAKSDNTTKFPILSHDEYLELRRVRYQDRQLGPLTGLDISHFDGAFLNIESEAKAFAERIPACSR